MKVATWSPGSISSKNLTSIAVISFTVILSVILLLVTDANAIVLSVGLMVTLSMLRVSVVLALILSAIVGGVYAGLPIESVVQEFNDGLGSGAPIALALAALGAFAVALSRTGVASYISSRMLAVVGQSDSDKNIEKTKWGIYILLLLISIASGTIVPVHIAFIPLLIPPLLLVFNKMQLDRRIIGCVICFGIVVKYMIFPVGYGAIYLNDILIYSINEAGAELDFLVTRHMAPRAMLIPAFGMLVGLLVAIMFTYRKKRVYSDAPIKAEEEREEKPLQPIQKLLVAVAIASTLIVQLITGSMVFGGMVGFSLLALSGVMRWSEQDTIFDNGMRMMAMVGFIMVAAAGFAAVMRATGDVPVLVEQAVALIGDSRALAALAMLIVGLIITMGIGSSFSTVPIIAAIFVPMGLAYDFSAMAIIALIGTAGALGDAGSPVSDSTLGPTAGLNVDRQHDHIWDTVVPTFIHFNIPLIIFGWIAAMLL
ncbi:Na+/H+ antiporter NhaC family protein [Halomonas sp. PAR7]|nr:MULTISPECIES: Na+/H+ antiporter NhaC family protein [unclassified Halomonas]MDT0502134.1 Na+/H+ antiporter NhaC family protein [Halomonas sp. PAR7]MDT0591614.1 Na+/H+ antiporter NhaC family protein [Halomonas sp. PAR8]